MKILPNDQTGLHAAVTNLVVKVWIRYKWFASAMRFGTPILLEWVVRQLSACDCTGTLKCATFGNAAGWNTFSIWYWYQNGNSGKISLIVSLLANPNVDALIRRPMLSIGQTSITSSSWKLCGKLSSLICSSASAKGHNFLVACEFAWRVTVM